MEIYNTICKIDSQREFAVWLRELKQGLCDNREGWDGEGGGRGHGCVYLWLIHVDVWQKSAQYCKAVLQLKINFLLQKKRICLLRQWTQVQSLGCKDLTCLCHNGSSPCILELVPGNERPLRQEAQKSQLENSPRTAMKTSVVKKN